MIVEIEPRAIVDKARSLNDYPIKYIDNATSLFLRKSIPVLSPKSDNRNSLINLFDCYLGVTGQSITYLSLSSNHINKIFSGFIGALSCETFIEASKITRDTYVRTIIRALKNMSFDIPNLISDIDRNTARNLWMQMHPDTLQREYYNGWRVTSKDGKEGRSLRLAWIWDKLGFDIARSFYAAANLFTQRYEGASQGCYVPVLNDLFKYIESSHSKIVEKNLASPAFTTKVVEGFCRVFFEKKVGADNCLLTTIKRWNDALPFLEAVLLESGVFAKPNRPFPYIAPKRKTGVESNISRNKNGVVVKNKLILSVPLHMTDDEVIQLLFRKITNDVDEVLRWAQGQANSIFTRFKENEGEFDYRDFDLKLHKIKKKYKTTEISKARSVEIAYRLGLPTSYSLEPFVYLLIKERPSITESFLYTLELNDKHGKFVGIEKSDECTYLVGYKKRRGGKRSQLKVELNEKSIEIVDQIVQITEPLRKYLKAIGDDNYRYLFLSCRTGFAYPKRIAASLNSKRENAANDNRFHQFIESSENLDQKEIRQLIERLTPTRFRATVGVQVYLETGSAKAMSEALGHAKYKPDLLAHYLPEPILQFFQSRWIRIFQKGIVCEAMKDSPLLLRASNFTSMNELDKFLNNHALGLPDDPVGLGNDEDVSQVYISVDENILTLLLSLELAVALTDQKKISAKAKHWSKFASLLKVEIEKNSYDLEMNLALKKARSNLDPTLMQGLIIDTQVSQGMEG